MCLAIPGKVLDLFERHGALMGRVDFGGVTKEVCLAFTPDVAAGDYVVVHAGFAISRVDEAAARETLATFASLGAVQSPPNEEQGRETSG